jgi:hypothetical protein
MSGAAVRMTPQEEWWPRATAAKYLEVSVRKVRMIAAAGQIRRKHVPPAPGRPYQSVVYNADDVKAYKSTALAKDRATILPPMNPGAAAPASLLPQALALLGERLGPPVPPPRVKRWLTLDEAVEYSGLPRAYLLQQAREGAAFALNVGLFSRARWRFDRDQL